MVIKNVLKSEMKLYECSGQKGELLTKVDLSLKNISPTSIGKRFGKIVYYILVNF